MPTANMTVTVAAENTHADTVLYCWLKLTFLIGSGMAPKLC